MPIKDAEESNPDAALLAKLARDGWWHDPEQSEPLRAALMRLCATYLTRRPSPGNRIDPVARFHLGNGARLERINWLGNTAPRGIQESFGIMVNYLYDIETIESNHEAFVNDGTVMRSADVDALLAAEHISAPDSDFLRKHNPVTPRNNTPPPSELDAGKGSGEKLSRSDR
jgi:malonyl-CoA decarboxylase